MNHTGGLEALISSTPWGKSFDNDNIKEENSKKEKRSLDQTFQLHFKDLPSAACYKICLTIP